jgi:hypothetical protein
LILQRKDGLKNGVEGVVLIYENVFKFVSRRQCGVWVIPEISSIY